MAWYKPLHVSDYIKPDPELGPDVMITTGPVWGYSEAGVPVSDAETAQIGGFVAWQNRVRGYGESVGASSFMEALEGTDEFVGWREFNEAFKTAETPEEYDFVRQRIDSP